MTCVSKEYEIKTKMVQEQRLQVKMTRLFFYWVELGGWWRRGAEGGMSKFLAGWGESPQTHGRAHPVDTYILYIAYMKELIHLNFARFRHFVCRRYLWYIFSLVCQLFVIQ